MFVREMCDARHGASAALVRQIDVDGAARVFLFLAFVVHNLIYCLIEYVAE